MKKLLSLFLTIIMVLSLGCISTLAVTDYTEIRLAKSDTSLAGNQTGILKPEGFNGSSWVSIDPSLIEFSAQSRFVEIDENGSFKLTQEFHTAYNGTTGEKSLSTPITATYTLSNGTKLTKKVLVMFGSAYPNKIIAADASAKTNTLTFDYAVDFADGLTGTKVTSSEAAATTAEQNPNVSHQDSFYEGWFYDIDGTSQSDSSVGIIRFANDALSAVNVFNFYLKTSGTNYALADSLGTGEFSGNASSGGKVVAPRSIGWHQFAVDVCSGNRVRAYLDGVLLYEKTIVFSGSPTMRKVVPGKAGKFRYDKFNILRSKVQTNVKPQVSYANIVGEVSNGNTLTADYDVIFPNAHTYTASSVQWQVAQNAQASLAGDFTDISGATNNTYTVTDDTKIYRVKITPKSLNGSTVTGTAYTSAPLAKACAPVADVTIEGSVADGNILRGNYVYSDMNGDPENKPATEATFKWYISEAGQNDYTPISGETTNEYQVQPSDVGKDIIFGVTPKSTVAPFGDTEFRSEPAKQATAPEIKSASLSYDEKIELTYDYYDANNDPENNSKIEWYKSLTKEEGSWELTETTYSSEEKSEISATNLDGYYVKALITAIADSAPPQADTAFETEAVYIGKLAVTSVDITGNPLKGNTLTANYEISASDAVKANGYAVTVKWYVSDDGIDFDELSEGNTFVVPRANKYYQVKVTASNSKITSNTFTSNTISNKFTAVSLAYSTTMTTVGSSITPVLKGFADGKYYTLDNSEVKYSVSDNLILKDDKTVTSTKVGTGILSAQYFTGSETLETDVLLSFGQKDLVNLLSSSNITDAGKTDNHNIEGLTGPLAAKLPDTQKNIAPQADRASIRELWFYDDATGTTGGLAFNDWYLNEGAPEYRQFYLRLEPSGTKYKLSENNAPNEQRWLGGERTIGWHQLVIDGSTNGKVVFLLDGVKIYEKSANLTAGATKKELLTRVMQGDAGFYFDKWNTVSVLGYKPYAENTNITCDGTQQLNAGEKITVTYTSKTAPGTSSSTPSIKWYESDSYDGPFTEIEGKTDATFVIPASTTQKYYRAGITINDGNQTGEEIFSNILTKPTVPEARNVKIKGVNYTGSILFASFDFFDANGDRESTSVYQWYCDSNPNGTFSELIVDEFGSPIASSSLVVRAPYNQKYIRVAVTPKSQNDVTPGEKVYSASLSPFTKPGVDDIKITGEYGIGKTLKGSYVYENTSNADEGDSVLKWYRNNDLIKTSIKGVLGADEYTITTADTDCNIYFEVTPVCVDEGIVPQNECIGTAEKSAAFKGAVNPIGLSAYLSGALRPGNTISVEYTYTHEKDIPEGNTEYKIYVGGELKSNTKTLYITADMAGKSIYAVVYPKAAVEPSTGASIQTASSVIGYAVSTPITVGSGGGGGGSYASQDTPETLALKAVKNAIVLKINSNNALLNGYTAKVDENTMVAPFIENSRTLLPLRFIAESLGAKVMWTDETREIKITSGSNTVIMHLDSDIYTINGIEYKMDVKAKSVSGRTMIPVRYISEALNKEVFWDDKGIVIVSDKKNIFDSSKDSSLIDALITKLK